MTEVKGTCIRDLKKIIVCLGLPVTMWKRLGKGDQEFVFVALDILSMQMFQDSACWEKLK
jgi:hypothetical protein